HRRRLGGDPVRLPQRLPRARPTAGPQVLQGGQDTAPAMGGAFRSRGPPLPAAPRTRRATRARLLRAPHGRSADVLTTRKEARPNALARPRAAGGRAPPPLLGPALSAPRRGPGPRGPTPLPPSPCWTLCPGPEPSGPRASSGPSGPNEPAAPPLRPAKK